MVLVTIEIIFALLNPIRIKKKSSSLAVPLTKILRPLPSVRALLGKIGPMLWRYRPRCIRTARKQPRENISQLAYKSFYHMAR